MARKSITQKWDAETQRKANEVSRLLQEKQARQAAAARRAATEQAAVESARRIDAAKQRERKGGS